MQCRPQWVVRVIHVAELLIGLGIEGRIDLRTAPAEVIAVACVRRNYDQLEEPS